MNLPIKRSAFIAIAAAFAALAFIGYRHLNSHNSAPFRTVPVTRGDLRATISATGTVEPEEVIDVGAQVAGKIVTFGKDKNGKAIDYGSVVEAGMVLARIDDALYAADVAAAQAQLAQNQAGVQYAEANLVQLKAKLYQAEKDWGRAKKLGPPDALSQADYDAAQSAFETAKANVELGKAAILQAKNAVRQSEAALQRARQNLGYCTIQSPVRGVIIDRRVNIGQTVVASLSAPSLFLIAKDLNRIQIWVSVNEADIGRIRSGQPVTFTVDAYPGEVFKGEVGKVRLNATMTQKVVTYTVEVNTDNSSGKLLPYLTANVKFIVGESRGVFLVPNAALRWTPTPGLIALAAGKIHGKKSGERGSTPGSHGKSVGGSQPRGGVWIPQGRLVRAVPVRLGLSDDSKTEVRSEELREGVLVALGEQRQEMGQPASSAASPFTPQLIKPGGRSQH